MDVPERIEFDITNMNIGDSIRIVTPPPGVTFLTEADIMVLAVVEPAVMDTELDLAVAGEEAPEEAVEDEAEAEAAPEGEEGEGAEGEAVEGEEGEAAEGEGAGDGSAAAEGDGES